MQLSYKWPNKIQIREIALNKAESHPYDSRLEENNSVFELTSVKLRSDQVSGPDAQTCNLEEWLDKLAGFSQLTPRQVQARLELLQSPAYKFRHSAKKGEFGICPLPVSFFVDIEEEGHVGCGFICEDLLRTLLGGENVFAQRAICIQVRIYAPTLGIYKGMLMRKKIEAGPKVLLPTSMKKVPASNHPERNETTVTLLINQAGVDPGASSLQIGRLPSIDFNKTPRKSFKPKPLSNMMTRLLIGSGVPNPIVKEYEKASAKNIEKINHAFVRGVADPTGAIPPGKVFLTGIKNTNLLGEQVFVTRPPCLERSDGRLLKVVKGETIHPDAWRWLCALQFGAIIFAFPEKGKKTIPELLADGDLDGDRYFCCWEKSIIAHVADVFTQDEKSSVNDQVSDGVSMRYGWLSLAQERLRNIYQLRHINTLIQTLYKLSFQAADNGELFLEDPDAVHYAKAFKAALQNAKHGTKIFLPLKLHTNLPRNLQSFVTSELE
eukprot:GHVN01076579.1.p1 GENE.GHVN01076579.1~~GHVN01076579.1.p1  ORF type:complete len:510 (-),score=50.18 GHVN01076579.1:1119-2597(-)